MDLKLELVLIPVTDVDRAKAFYADKAGFAVHVDHQPSDDFRVVQLDPPGSACSITIGKGVTDAAPGSVKGTHLVVTDIEAARAELVARGAEASEVFHEGAPGARFQHDGPDGRVSGPAPEDASYGSFVSFSDPDGNGWLVQEVNRSGPTAERP
jgi:catechol 2,3-dioxygenase-like lactoylglutathione lyase family enzyme